MSTFSDLGVLETCEPLSLHEERVAMHELAPCIIMSRLMQVQV